MSKVTPCSNPPGGTIICNDDQLAICGVVDGKIVAGCFDPPPAASRFIDTNTRRDAVANWALTMITSEDRDLRSPISGYERAILALGKYKHPVTGDEVSFTMPREEESGTPQATPQLRYQ